MPKLTVHLEYDHGLECPNDQECEWKLYSFGRKHNNYTDPTKIGLSLAQDADGIPIVLDKKLVTKLKNGLAHWCSYYEHSGSWWGRKAGAIPAGVEFRWDGRRIAGILIWEHKSSEIGAKTYAARAQDADGFLKRYTSWANGEGYSYRIVLDEGGDNEVDGASCGGFDDADYMLSEMVDLLVGEEFTVTGDAAHLEKQLRELVAKGATSTWQPSSSTVTS